MKAPTIIQFWRACLCVLLCAGCQKEIRWPFYVSTYAGGREYGPLEGNRDSVVFIGPDVLAINADGDLFVSDEGSYLVRKIIRGGTVGLVAGTTRGFDDGPGTSARFNVISGLAVDAAGVVYVADRYNQRIRKIAPGGYVSTLAGNGIAGYADGTGEAAEFDNPLGLAVDAQGNVYVADSRNNRIRKVEPDGRVSTVAGDEKGYTDGTGPAAWFSEPVDLAIDRGGNLYVVDLGNQRIRKIHPDGTVSTLAGSGTAGFVDGAGDAAQFGSPEGITVDKHGNVYVADTENNCIRKITPSGSVSTIAGNGIAGVIDGAGNTAQFNGPSALAVDAGADFLFVADRGNRRIRKIDLR